mgnify:CR=1 FL=1
MAINGSDKSFAFMEFPLSMSRQDAFPLDKNSVFYSMSDAQTNPAAYVGQVIAVVEEGVSTVYQIKNAAGELEALGTGDLEGDVDAIVDDRIATDGEVAEMISEIFGSEDPEA